MSKKKRITVMAQVAVAIVLSTLALSYGTKLVDGPQSTDTVGRLAYVLPWLVLPGLILLALIVITGMTRFFDEEAFDGTRTPSRSFLEINLRVIQNTVEQVILGIVVWLGLAVALPAERLELVPVLIMLFVSGRVLFWIGYQMAPQLRATGFALTFLPTAIGLIWLIGGLLRS